MAAHLVDGRDLEALVDENLDLGAVGLADVRLVGRPVVDVRLRPLDRALDLVQRRRRDLLGDVTAQGLLLFAVGADVAPIRAPWRRLVAGGGGLAPGGRGRGWGGGGAAG